MATTLVPGMRVRVHVNLHKGNFSVVDPRTGRVIANVSDAVLSDVTFRWQRACVDRIAREGVRAVCAYAVGTLVSWDTAPGAGGIRVAYNPFRRPDFHRADTGATVDTAPRVVFTDRRAYLA